MTSCADYNVIQLGVTLHMTNSGKPQDFRQSLALGARGVAEVSAFLESDLVKQSWFDTHFIHNVENDERYRGYDIDLLWVVPVGNFLECRTIEVKSDRNHHTGNFFFETVSVEQRDKPGAFVITRAEWLFYYFIDAEELYCLPTRYLKPWFLQNEDDFPEKRAQTDDNERMFSWTTVGRIVPIERVTRDTQGWKHFKKQSDSWTAV